MHYGQCKSGEWIFNVDNTEQLKNMNDQILESEKKIRDKLERLTADPVEEVNQEKGMCTYKLCYKKTTSHLGCTL